MMTATRIWITPAISSSDTSRRYFFIHFFIPFSLNKDLFTGATLLIVIIYYILIFLSTTLLLFYKKNAPVVSRSKFAIYIAGLLGASPPFWFSLVRSLEAYGNLNRSVYFERHLVCTRFYKAVFRLSRPGINSITARWSCCEYNSLSFFDCVAA